MAQSLFSGWESATYRPNTEVKPRFWSGFANIHKFISLRRMPQFSEGNPYDLHLMGGGEKPPKTRTSSTAYHPSPRYVTQSESQSLNTLFTAMICEALNFSIPEIFIETSTRLNIWLIMSTKIFEKQCHNRHALTVNPALISPRRIAKQTKGTKECETRSHLKSTRAWKGGNSAAGTQRSDTTERKLAETEKQTKRKQGHLITSFHIVTMSATALSICAIKSKLL